MNKWKKRKRDTQITASRKLKSQPCDDDGPLDEDDDDDLDIDRNQPEFDDDPHVSYDLHSSAAAEADALSDGDVRLSNFPSVVGHTVNRPQSSVLAIVALEKALQREEIVSSWGQLENLSFGQLQLLSAVPLGSPVLTGGDDAFSAYVIRQIPIRKGNGVVKQWETKWTHVWPIHSDWFSPSSIDRIERQVVLHFFSGRSADHTPKKYFECRNIIVAKYLENPEKRLSVSESHGLKVGIDNDDITRIFRFLDNWGITNYCAPPQVHENKNDVSYLSEDAKGELCVPATSLKAIDSLIQFDKAKCMLKAADVYPELVSRGHQTSDLDCMIRVALTEMCCNYCSRPLAAVYYRLQKEIDAQLCLECFNEGRFVIGLSSLDFVKFDATKNYGDQDGESWSDQGTLSLLEGIEIYNDNWNKIAELVGNKTKAQCIAHFMRLGADEGLFDYIRIPSPSQTMSLNLINGDDCGRSQSRMNGESAGSSLEIHDSETKIPFAKSGNLVMSQVVFLASAVGPRVAAVCAHASLATLSIGAHAADLGKLGMINGSASGNMMNSESRNAKEGGPSADITNSVQQKEESGQDDVDDSPLSSERVQKAARAGLSAAAMKAKLFADHEERKIQGLSANIIIRLSEAMNKRKKRKRDTQITASCKLKSQPHDDDDPLDEVDGDDLDIDRNQPEFDDDQHVSNDLHSSAAAETDVLSDGGVRLSNFPSVVGHTVNRPHSSVLAIVALEKALQREEIVSSWGQLENVSFGQLQSLSAVPLDSQVLTGGHDAFSAYEIRQIPLRKGNGVLNQWETKCTHVLPIHSDRFSPSSIERIERQVVPHFFSGKSADHTPKKYLECRNIIVAKYLENPEKRLSVSETHGLIVGIDNDDITRIFRFLENWGIINYYAPPQFHENKSDVSYLSEDAKGELCVPATSLKAIDSLIQFDKAKCMLKAADVYPELVSRGHQTSDLDSMIRVALSEMCCNHCSRPLTAVYYRSQIENDAQLCLECLIEGRFVIGHSSLDFVKFDATKNYGDQDGGSWTDQATLSLLEGIEIYNNNWNQIAGLVGKKTKAQSIAHFMRLGADVGLFDNIRIPSPSQSMSLNLINGDDCGRSQSRMNEESTGSILDIHDSETTIIFAKSGNPVMSQVAFLASEVGPRVSAACADASLATLSIGDCAAALVKLGMVYG